MSILWLAASSKSSKSSTKRKKRLRNSTCIYPFSFVTILAIPIELTAARRRSQASSGESAKARGATRWVLSLACDETQFGLLVHAANCPATAPKDFGFRCDIAPIVKRRTKATTGRAARTLRFLMFTWLSHDARCAAADFVCTPCFSWNHTKKHISLEGVNRVGTIEMLKCALAYGTVISVDQFDDQRQGLVWHRR